MIFLKKIFKYRIARGREGEAKKPVACGATPGPTRPDVHILDVLLPQWRDPRRRQYLTFPRRRNDGTRREQQICRRPGRLIADPGPNPSPLEDACVKTKLQKSPCQLLRKYKTKKCPEIFTPASCCRNQIAKQLLLLLVYIKSYYV
jgi:hypothetical protein